MSPEAGVRRGGAVPMEVSATLPVDTALADVAGWARRVERLGLDVLQVPETVHDPFVVSALVLEHTERLRVRTSMVVAFPRSPMVTAYSAWDLARFSGGRFDLGLGTQVRGNIVHRYSAEWDDPVARLRDYVASVRAIFASFQSGAPLAHTGRYYRFSRLQPYFDPGPLSVRAPAIWTGAVGPRMCALAGEVADGLVCHPTASHPDYLGAVIAPALTEGAARTGAVAGRDGRRPRVVVNARPLTGRTAADVARARSTARNELAFLYTTPAYRRPLAALGLADLGERLTALASRERWDELGALMTDETVDRLVPQAPYAGLPDLLTRWYAGRCDGINLALPAEAEDDEEWAAVVAGLRAIPAGPPVAAMPPSTEERDADARSA